VKIIKLEVSNIKRVRAVTIVPKGDVVLIGGANGAGKSSTLDAIEMALSGKKAVPVEPVHHGARRARIVVDLGDIVVERTFDAKGTQLVVRAADGVPQPSPQSLLDSLCSRVCFDPLSFARMEPKQQDELLKKLVGLDFSDLQTSREHVFAKRSEANKEIKRLEAVLDSTEAHPDAPKELVDVAALTDKLQVHRNAVGARNAQKALVDGDVVKLGVYDEQIQKLERELSDLRAKRAAFAIDVDKRILALPPEPPSIDDVQEQLRTAETKNAKVRANAEHAKLDQELKSKSNEAEQLTGAIEELDKQKADRLAAAKFPIEGLGFDEAGPTFKGVPLAQASQAERLRLSVAIGAAMNPKVNVMLIREGSLLDDNSLALLEQLAHDTGAQCWVERVGTKDPTAVIIEDGAVLEEPAVANGVVAHEGATP